MTGIHIKNGCAKQTVMAMIIKNGNCYIGFNECLTPQKVCPREGMETGEGYHLCKERCHQTGHAEENACKLAGEDAKDSTLYLIGHYYCCEHCKKIMKEYGIVDVVFNKFPENFYDNRLVL